MQRVRFGILALTAALLAPQLALSVFSLTQLPQFESPAGQQMLVPVTE